MTPANLDDVALVDPDDCDQVRPFATELGIDPMVLAFALRRIRDQQRIDRQIEAYWRNNPDPQPRRTA